VELGVTDRILTFLDIHENIDVRVHRCFQNGERFREEGLGWQDAAGPPLPLPAQIRRAQNHSEGEFEPKGALISVNLIAFPNSVTRDNWLGVKAESPGINVALIADNEVQQP